MEIVPFHRSHLESLKMGHWDRVAFEHEDYDAFLQKYEGHAASGMVDGRCVGIAGITVEKQVGFGWIFLSDEIREKPVFLTKLIQRGIEIAAKDLNIKSIMAAVLIGHDKAQRWARILGFKPLRSDGEYRYFFKNLSHIGGY